MAVYECKMIHKLIDNYILNIMYTHTHRFENKNIKITECKTQNKYILGLGYKRPPLNYKKKLLKKLNL